MEKKKRIDAIDAARGLALVLMVIHHFLIDLVNLCGAPMWIFSNPVFDVLHYIFAGLFIFLAGLCCRFSHSNLRRGVICFAIAMGITVVSSLPFIDDPIRFGVLHLLGFSMVFFALTHRAWDAIPRKAAPVFYIGMTVFTAWLVEHTSIGPAAHWLFPFGWTYRGFYTADWFPIFPWVFVFLLGTWAGLYVVEHKLPERFYTFTCPVLPQIGRKSLLIYVLHQPILYALIMGVQALLR